jgi:hypothetical protein
MIPCYRISSPLGEIVLRAEDDFLTGLFFDRQKNFPTFSVVTAHQRMPAVIQNGFPAACLARIIRDSLRDDRFLWSDSAADRSSERCSSRYRKRQR